LGQVGRCRFASDDHLDPRSAAQGRRDLRRHLGADGVDDPGQTFVRGVEGHADRQQGDGAVLRDARLRLDA
jgi:hypothetical protein